MSLNALIRATMKSEPRRYQVQGVRFVQRRNGKAIIGDDMGVGKTYQAIAYLATHAESLPALVVCPANAKFVWLSQLKEHAGMSAFVCEGRTPKRLRHKIWIINYAILHHWEEALIDANPRGLVIDECHRIKTMTAKRTMACRAIAKECDCNCIIPMSGTPILNSPIEFFPALNLVAPDLFPAYWKYAMRYCKPRRGYRGRGWIFSGCDHPEELHKIAGTVMIRRMKQQVLTELPDRTVNVIPVRIDNRREYRRACDEFVTWLRDTKGAKAAKKARGGAVALMRIGALKKLVAVGKLKGLIDWITNWFDTTDRKLVVFAWHRDITQAIIKAFPGCSHIIGGTKTKLRQRAVRRFQCNPNVRLFVGNIKAAGECITLTAASDVLFAEIGWTPGEHDQASDRVLRIGQTAKKVSVYYMVGQRTIEEDILQVIDDKRKVVNAILDGEAAATSVVTALLEKMRRR